MIYKILENLKITHSLDLENESIHDYVDGIVFLNNSLNLIRSNIIPDLLNKRKNIFHKEINELQIKYSNRNSRKIKWSGGLIIKDPRSYKIRPGDISIIGENGIFIEDDDNMLSDITLDLKLNLNLNSLYIGENWTGSFNTEKLFNLENFLVKPYWYFYDPTNKDEDNYFKYYEKSIRGLVNKWANSGSIRQDGILYSSYIDKPQLEFFYQTNKIQSLVIDNQVQNLNNFDTIFKDSVNFLNNDKIITENEKIILQNLYTSTKEIKFLNLPTSDIVLSLLNNSDIPLIKSFYNDQVNDEYNFYKLVGKKIIYTEGTIGRKYKLDNIFNNILSNYNSILSFKQRQINSFIKNRDILLDFENYIDYDITGSNGQIIKTIRILSGTTVNVVGNPNSGNIQVTGEINETNAADFLYMMKDGDIGKYNNILTFLSNSLNDFPIGNNIGTAYSPDVYTGDSNSSTIAFKYLYPLQNNNDTCFSIRNIISMVTSVRLEGFNNNQSFSLFDDTILSQSVDFIRKNYENINFPGYHLFDTSSFVGTYNSPSVITLYEALVKALIIKKNTLDIVEKFKEKIDNISNSPIQKALFNKLYVNNFNINEYIFNINKINSIQNTNFYNLVIGREDGGNIGTNNVWITETNNFKNSNTDFLKNISLAFMPYDGHSVELQHDHNTIAARYLRNNSGEFNKYVIDRFIIVFRQYLLDNFNIDIDITEDEINDLKYKEETNVIDIMSSTEGDDKKINPYFDRENLPLPSYRKNTYYFLLDKYKIKYRQNINNKIIYTGINNNFANFTQSFESLLNIDYIKNDVYDNYNGLKISDINLIYNNLRIGGNLISIISNINNFYFNNDHSSSYYDRYPLYFNTIFFNTITGLNDQIGVLSSEIYNLINISSSGFFGKINHNLFKLKELYKGQYSNFFSFFEKFINLQDQYNKNDYLYFTTSSNNPNNNLVNIETSSILNDNKIGHNISLEHLYETNSLIGTYIDLIKVRKNSLPTIYTKVKNLFETYSLYDNIRNGNMETFEYFKDLNNYMYSFVNDIAKEINESVTDTTGKEAYVIQNFYSYISRSENVTDSGEDEWATRSLQYYPVQGTNLEPIYLWPTSSDFIYYLNSNSSEITPVISENDLYYKIESILNRLKNIETRSFIYNILNEKTSYIDRLKEVQSAVNKSGDFVYPYQNLVNDAKSLITNNEFKPFETKLYFNGSNKFNTSSIFTKKFLNNFYIESKTIIKDIIKNNNDLIYEINIDNTKPLTIFENNNSSTPKSILNNYLNFKNDKGNLIEYCLETYEEIDVLNYLINNPIFYKKILLLINDKIYNIGSNKKITTTNVYNIESGLFENFIESSSVFNWININQKLPITMSIDIQSMYNTGSNLEVFPYTSSVGTEMLWGNLAKGFIKYSILDKTKEHYNDHFDELLYKHFIKKIYLKRTEIDIINGNLNIYLSNIKR